MIPLSVFKKISDVLWEIPKTYRADMRVPARVFASRKQLEDATRDDSLEQLVNLATLPGIVQAALAMPDVHEGYGSPVGGVAATDTRADGLVSPGMIGYDINCGVRLLRSSLSFQELRPQLSALAHSIFRGIPSGVGRGGGVALGARDLDRILAGGPEAVVKMGFGQAADLTKNETGGKLPDADPELVSTRAKQRGRDQLGTMGAGNHFVEVQVVEQVFDPQAADAMGLQAEQVCVMIHTGSRGLGHQVATDYIKVMLTAMPKYKVELPDRELAGAPFSSDEAQDYLAAMRAAANYAFANRQRITWLVRREFEYTLKKAFSLDVVYDLAHNVGKLEEHDVAGKKRRLLVHRKGATRAFAGQPVLIPGSMGSASYVLVGAERAMHESFGSACHGAGRRLS